MTFYKKKKRKVGPSKNEEKVRRGQAAQAEADAAGTLSSRGARSLTVKLTVTSPQGVILQEDEHTYGANDAFVVEADCPGACGSGSYDFAPAIADALSRRQAQGEGEAACAESGYGAGTACGCVARYRFTADF